MSKKPVSRQVRRARERIAYKRRLSVSKQAAMTAKVPGGAAAIREPHNAA